MTLLAAAPLAVERYGLEIPQWTGEVGFQSLCYLICLVVQALLCRHVFVKAWETLSARRCAGAVVTALAFAVTAGDCLMGLFSPARTRRDALRPGGVYAAGLCPVGGQPGEPGDV